MSPLLCPFLEAALGQQKKTAVQISDNFLTINHSHPFLIK